MIWYCREYNIFVSSPTPFTENREFWKEIKKNKYKQFFFFPSKNLSAFTELKENEVPPETDLNHNQDSSAVPDLTCLVDQHENQRYEICDHLGAGSSVPA